MTRLPTSTVLVSTPSNPSRPNTFELIFFGDELDQVELFGPKGHRAIYTKKGEAWWETALGECFSQGAALDLFQEAARRLA